MTLYWHSCTKPLVDFTKSCKSKISRKCEFQPIKSLEITLTITLTINLRLTTFCEIDPRTISRHVYVCVRVIDFTYDVTTICRLHIGSDSVIIIYCFTTLSSPQNTVFYFNFVGTEFWLGKMHSINSDAKSSKLT